MLYRSLPDRLIRGRMIFLGNVFVITRQDGMDDELGVRDFRAQANDQRFVEHRNIFDRILNLEIIDPDADDDLCGTERDDIAGSLGEGFDFRSINAPSAEVLAR